MQLIWLQRTHWSKCRNVVGSNLNIRKGIRIDKSNWYRQSCASMLPYVAVNFKQGYVVASLWRKSIRRWQHRHLVKVRKRLNGVVVELFVAAIYLDRVTHFTVKLLLNIRVLGQKVADQRHSCSFSRKFIEIEYFALISSFQTNITNFRNKCLVSKICIQ